MILHPWKIEPSTRVLKPDGWWHTLIVPGLGWKSKAGFSAFILHSIECRINAEDPSKDFQPSPGTISVCHQPSGFRTRVDGSIFQGCKITPYYDSLIAKVICKGRNRTEAIQRTLRSLDEFVLEGITTTIELHKKILKHKKFLGSSFDTNWLGKEKFF